MAREWSDTDAVEEGDLAELGFGSILTEPPLEHLAPRQIRDPMHGGLPLPFLSLIEIRPHEHPAVRPRAPAAS